MDLSSSLERMKSEDVSLVRDSGETDRLSLSLISGPEMIQRFSRHNQQLFTSSLHSAFHPPRFSAFNLVGTFPAPARPDAPSESTESPGLYSPEQAEAESNKRKSSVKNSGSCKKTREKSTGKQTTSEEAVGS